MNKTKIIGIVSSALVIVSAWLPWVTLAGISANGFDGNEGQPGLFFVILGALSALCVFFGKKWSNIVAVLLALATIGLAFKYINDASSFAGYGLYIMLAGGLGVIAAAIMGLRKK